MILLDTNILSEFMRERPDSHALAWLDSQSKSELFISSVTEAELRYGVERLPPGRRRDQLADTVFSILTEDFTARILPFDSAAALAYAIICAARHRAGRPISQFDAQIAATARSLGASLATRDTGGFEGCGVDLINPWSAGGERKSE